MIGVTGPRRAAALDRLDALLPPEMARRAEDVGGPEDEMDALRMFALAVPAEAFIALGGVFHSNAVFSLTRSAQEALVSTGAVARLVSIRMMIPPPADVSGN